MKNLDLTLILLPTDSHLELDPATSSGLDLSNKGSQDGDLNLQRGGGWSGSDEYLGPLVFLPPLPLAQMIADIKMNIRIDI